MSSLGLCSVLLSLAILDTLYGSFAAAQTQFEPFSRKACKTHARVSDPMNAMTLVEGDDEAFLLQMGPRGQASTDTQTFDGYYGKVGNYAYVSTPKEENHVRNVYDFLGGTLHNHPSLKKMGDKHDDYHGAGKNLDTSNKHNAYRRDHSSEYKRSGNALIQSGAAKPWHHMTVKEVHRCTKLIKVYKKEIVNECSEIKANFTVVRKIWGKIKHLPSTKTESTCMKVPVWRKTDKCVKFVKMKKACKKVPRVKVSHTCMKHFQVYKKEVVPKCHEKNKHFLVARHVFGKLKPVHVRKSEKVCVHMPVWKKVRKCMKWLKKPQKEFVEQCVEKGMGWMHY